jgi:uncharacterized protein
MDTERREYVEGSEDEAVLRGIERAFEQAILSRLAEEGVEAGGQSLIRELEGIIARSVGSRYRNSVKAEAHALLGKVYECGVFGERSLSKAYFHYKVAAEHNNPYGCYRIAYFYENGIANPVKMRKAAFFYKLAANGGCVRGLHKYGLILLHGGKGCSRNPRVGVFYLGQAQRLATKSYPHPVYDYALCHEASSGLEKYVIIDEPYALKLYKEGAALGCVRSMVRLASVYMEGELGETPDPEAATVYYRDAAERKSPEARMALYKGCREGGKEKDAVYWLKKAAEIGHPDGAHLYAELLEHQGRTVAAYWWFKVAYARGSSRSKKKIRELSRHL